MNIKRKKVILYAAFSLCFIWPFINLAVLMLPMNGECKILVGTWGTADFFQIVWNCIAFISGTLLCVMHDQLKTEHRWSDQFLLGLKVFGLVALLLISNAICWVLDELEGCHHSFSSPNGVHTIIVQETQIIHDVRITIYERINPLLICSRAIERKNNANKPIETDDYSLSWEENRVTFLYNDGKESIVVPLD